MFNRISQSILLIFMGCLGCSQGSYLQTHTPWELIFQKKVSGGTAELVGTELNAPSFSLYANGRVIYYRYLDGKRKMAESNLTREEFLELLKSVSDQLTPVDSVIIQDESTNAPVTEYYFYGRRIHVKGFIPPHDAFEKFNTFIDRMHFKNSRDYIPKKIVLYVKRLSSGDITNWPEWKFHAIDLQKIYKKNIDFYEPNVDENSFVIDGNSVKKVLNFIEQAGVYKKCSWKNRIYAVGYRPVLPDKNIH